MTRPPSRISSYGLGTHTELWLDLPAVSPGKLDFFFLISPHLITVLIPCLYTHIKVFNELYCCVGNYRIVYVILKWMSTPTRFRKDFSIIHTFWRNSREECRGNVQYGKALSECIGIRASEKCSMRMKSTWYAVLTFSYFCVSLVFDPVPNFTKRNPLVTNHYLYHSRNLNLAS